MRDAKGLGMLEGDVPNLYSNDEAQKDYMMVMPQYVPHRGLVRYSHALKHLIPIRKRNPRKNVITVDDAGFFSFLTYSWMTKYVWQAYKQGLTMEDIPLGSPQDACDLNAQRLEVLWQEELSSRGPSKASLGRTIWRFARTRLLLAAFVFSMSCFMGFLAPTVFMRKLLEWCEGDESVVGAWQHGVYWAVALAAAELFRMLFFCLCWSIGYRTATRLRAACLAMIYRKILTLNSLHHKSTGELMNVFANDGPRLFYMVVFGPMIVGGPLVALCGVTYILTVLSPWALLGMLTFILFYPVQYFLSRLNGYYRGKAIAVADTRVKLMNELLNSIKLIKMYAWEDAFASQIRDARAKEVRFIRKTGYCQSLGITMAPTVPVISGIITFAAHVLAGGNLTASQTFTVLTLLSKYLRQALMIVKDGLFHLHQGLLSLVRLKAFPVLAFLSKLLRMALKHLQESCTAIQDALVSIPRLKAFPLVTILTSQLRAALMNVRYGLDNLQVGLIVFARAKELLLMEEVKVLIEKPTSAEDAVQVVDATFVHQASGPTEVSDEETKLQDDRTDIVPLLSDVSLTIKKGEIVGVCGAVGSGKSSLLLAMLGQLPMPTGHIYRDGTIAFVSQQPWIQNATLKDNILFGESFNAQRYINAVYCCALNEDVHLLPGGDETEIGERGVNLSGGQKQRVALARALYADRDVYLLDDVLSAVDAQVGAHILQHAIQGELRRKKRTVIIVTHQVAQLSQCDKVVVVKSGRIEAIGPHEELMQSCNHYQLLVQAAQFTNINLNSDDDVGSEVQSSPSSPAAEQVPAWSKAVKAGGAPEEQLRGEIRGYAYTAYIKAAGGMITCVIPLLSIFVNTGINAFSSYWLAQWIRAGSGNGTKWDAASNSTVASDEIIDNPDLNWYMNIYMGTVGLIVATSLLRSVVITRATVRAGRFLHDALFKATIHSPLRYFEITPLGRILNVFAKDLDEIESRLPSVLETMLQNIWTLVFAFLFITLVFPWFIIPLVMLAGLYWYISKIFRVSVRDLQRMDNISRAPVLSAVSATIQGLPTIHAFGKHKQFLAHFSALFDENSTCLYLSCNAMRWMATRLNTISVTITCITALMVVGLKGEVPAAMAGLALTYTAHISGVFQFTIRLMSEAEQRFISVERIQTSIQTLPAEGDNSTTKPPEGWPSRGSIRFKDVSLSYAEHLPPVLTAFTLSVRPGEQLGVVGRTGAGKSSLISALFRLVELSKGVILIDGIDIAQLQLSALRRAMAVIPQDPVLFNGSFRYNLDPFGKHADSELWETLRKTALERKVQRQPEGLDTVVGEGGDSLSLGEMQLLCLARALLRKCKILLLDEATASVDPETEETIQRTIRSEFGGCTVVTIAHRLATITSADRVLLVDHGSVVELDEPEKLLADRSSQFAQLAAATGFIPS